MLKLVRVLNVPEKLLAQIAEIAAVQLVGLEELPLRKHVMENVHRADNMWCVLYGGTCCYPGNADELSYASRLFQFLAGKISQLAMTSHRTPFPQLVDI